MASKQVRVEEIINKMSEAEVLLSRGQNVAQAYRHLGVSEQLYCRLLLIGKNRLVFFSHEYMSFRLTVLAVPIAGLK
jgi:hypothetical protein